MKQDVIKFWVDAKDEIIDTCIKLSTNDVILDSNEGYQGNRTQMFDRLWTAVVQDMQSGHCAKTEEVVGGLAREAVRYSHDVEPIQRTIEFLMESSQEVVKSQFKEDPDKISQFNRYIKEHLDKAMIVLAKSVIKTQQEVIHKQKDYLLELSTPVMPLLDGILVLPLIGTIDTRRAKQIMDNLLNGIVKAQADTVLIDISGVPIVDTQVAHHLMKTVQAARLLGARCIIVGIRPNLPRLL